MLKLNLKRLIDYIQQKIISYELVPTNAEKGSTMVIMGDSSLLLVTKSGEPWSNSAIFEVFPAYNEVILVERVHFSQGDSDAVPFTTAVS